MTETSPQPPKCCPHCSADIRQETNGTCWHCGKLLEPQPMKAQAPVPQIIEPPKNNPIRIVLLTRKEMVLYIMAVGVYFLMLVAAAPIADFSKGVMFKFLYLSLSGSLGVITPENLQAMLPISPIEEITLLLLNPGFCSSFFIGCILIDKPWHLWKGLVPLTVIISPIALLCVIPSPMMLAFPQILLFLLAISLPQTIFGSLLAWLLYVPMRKYTAKFSGALDGA